MLCPACRLRTQFIGVEIIMSVKRNVKKILWAVDAFGDKAIQSRISKILKPITLGLNANAEPVYVLSASGFPGMTDREGVLAHLPRAEAKLHELVKKSSLQKIENPKILVQAATGSVRNDVSNLLSYAKECGAEVIVVATQAKSGFERLFMGSFAETLLLSSKIPVITVNPQGKIPTKFSSILFVTNFSNESEVAFKKVLDFAKQLKAKVTLFHQSEHEKKDVPKNVLSRTKAKWTEAESELLSKENLAVKRKANAWLELAKTSKVPCNVHFEYGLRNTADAAIEVAHKLNADIIALASTKGRLVSTLIGSTTRWLVRSAPTPVWVLHISK